MMTNNRLANARCWDAGDVGCGELAVGLRRELARVSTGGVLKLTARNAGAPADLQAWCRMTGNTLIYASHPVYVVEKGER